MSGSLIRILDWFFPLIVTCTNNRMRCFQLVMSFNCFTYLIFVFHNHIISVTMQCFLWVLYSKQHIHTCERWISFNCSETLVIFWNIFWIHYFHLPLELWKRFYYSIPVSSEKASGKWIKLISFIEFAWSNFFLCLQVFSKVDVIAYCQMLFILVCCFYFGEIIISPKRQILVFNSFYFC